MSLDTYSSQFPFIVLSSVDPVESEPGSLQVLVSATCTLGGSSPASTKFSDDIMVCESLRWLLVGQRRRPSGYKPRCLILHFDSAV